MVESVHSIFKLVSKISTLYVLLPIISHPHRLLEIEAFILFLKAVTNTKKNIFPL